MIWGWDTIVDIHHIVPRRHGGTNALANLIALCPNHHRMADRGLISQEELSQIILSAIAQLPDHLRQSGLQEFAQFENEGLGPLFDQPESPNQPD
jgi:predicted restriction endonuclease